METLLYLSSEGSNLYMLFIVYEVHLNFGKEVDTLKYAKLY